MDNKSLRTFGLIWSFIFLVIALFPLLNDEQIKKWSLVVSLSFLSISIFIPRLYYQIHFYQNWIKFGNFIGKINSKIIILILFYFIFLPIGLILKIFRKDLLHKKLDKNAKSYFIDRKEPFGNMENQF